LQGQTGETAAVKGNLHASLVFPSWALQPFFNGAFYFFRGDTQVLWPRMTGYGVLIAEYTAMRASLVRYENRDYKWWHSKQ